jgi:hypothetical protein
MTKELQLRDRINRAIDYFIEREQRQYWYNNGQPINSDTDWDKAKARIDRHLASRRRLADNRDAVMDTMRERELTCPSCNRLKPEHTFAKGWTGNGKKYICYDCCESEYEIMYDL